MRTQFHLAELGIVGDNPTQVIFPRPSRSRTLPSGNTAHLSRSKKNTPIARAPVPSAAPLDLCPWVSGWGRPCQRGAPWIWDDWFSPSFLMIFYCFMFKKIFPIPNSLNHFHFRWGYFYYQINMAVHSREIPCTIPVFPKVTSFLFLIIIVHVQF